MERRTLLSAALTFNGTQSVFGGTNVRVSFDAATRQSEMSVAINPTNPLNMVAFTHRIGASATMGTYYTFDGGDTWISKTIDNTVDGITGTFRFDPTLAFDAQGRLFVSYGVDPSGGTRRLVVIRSLDGGQTYPTVSTVATNSTLDKWVINTGRDPVTVTQQNVYLAYRVTSGAVTSVRVAVSKDGGGTWPTDTLVPDDAQAGADSATFGMPAVGPNGELYVIWDDFDGQPTSSSVKMAFSADAGSTFAPDRLVSTTGITRGNANGFTPTSGTRYHIAAQPDRGILTVPSIAVDRSTGPNRGRVYAAYTVRGTGGGTNNTDVVVRYSDDDGVSWSGPTIVHNFGGNTASQFLPWMDVDDHSGAVAVAFYDTRNSGTNQLAELWASVSVDGGTTWSESALATAQSNQSLSNASRYGGNYLEYIGLAVRDGTVQATWADTRDSLGDLEVYTARASIQSASNGNALAIIPDPSLDNHVTILPSLANSSFIEVLVNGVREYAGLAATLDSIILTTGNGMDLIEVFDLPSFITMVINSGGSDDTINIDRSGTAALPISVSAGAGDDILNINPNGAGTSAVVLKASDHFASVSVSDGGTLSLGAGGSNVIYTGALTIGAAGTLDLNDNDLVIDYTLGSPAATVQALINSARALGAWTGFGLTSTFARTNPNSNTTLGLLESAEYWGVYGAGTLFSGETIDSTAVLVKYTYYGDTDLSGFIDLDDYANTDGGYLLNLTGWLNGDFDGSGGKPDLDDYSLIDAAFLTQGAPL
ncbi:MAG: exo-alpha-sialidase [Tepidisphaeraceae bacterium]